jgi:hypothetical protein
MSSMPKKIDPELKARAVRLVSEHRGEYPTLTAASQAVAKQVGVGKESVRLTASPQIAVDPVLDLRGISGAPMRLYPVVDHIADKLCATQAMYGED